MKDDNKTAIAAVTGALRDKVADLNERLATAKKEKKTAQDNLEQKKKNCAKVQKEKEMQAHQILKLELEPKSKSADVKKKKKKITYESDSDSASSSSSKEAKKEKSKKIAKKKSKAKKSDKGKTTKKRVTHKVDAVASPIARMAEPLPPPKQAPGDNQHVGTPGETGGHGPNGFPYYSRTSSCTRSENECFESAGGQGLLEILASVAANTRPDM